MRVRLRRRGVDHGWVAAASRETSLERGEPVVVRGAVRAGASMRIVERLRAGEDLPRIAAAPRGFRWAGVSVNATDRREMHKLHVKPGGLYVKVNWLSAHPGDASLRLRFSYGTEIVDDFVDDPAQARASVRLAEGLFPECRRVTRRRWPVRGRFIQPIVYANAPDGGALFHHDDVPGQAAVVFAQFAGRTAWLALPARGRPADTPATTRRLAAEGWLFLLRPGDAIVMPRRVWHSVFTVGRGPNLALSVGIAGP